MILNKWQRELIQLGLQGDLKRAKQLQTMYRKLLRNLKAVVRGIDTEAPYWLQLQRGYYQNLIRELTQLIQDSGIAVMDLTKEALLDEFEKGYDEIFYLASQEGLEVSFNYVPKEVLNQMLYQPIVGANFSELLWANTGELAKQVNRLLMNGIIQGMSNAKIAQQLAEVVNSDYYRASRIVRTEALRFHSLGQQESYKEARRLNVPARKQWSAVMDSRTRESHQYLHGQEVGLEEYFTLEDGSRALGPRLFKIASEDIHCRCWTIATFDDLDNEKPTKRSRSYSDWKKRRDTMLSVGSIN